MKSFSQIDREAIIHEIILWMCEEHQNESQVKKSVLEMIEDISDEEISGLIDEAFKTVEKVHEENNKRPEIVALHILWYENIFRFFDSIKHASGVNKVLKAKEKLVGLHNLTNKVILERREKVIHNASSSIEYDTTKLTNEELFELEGLLRIAIVE